MVQHRSHPYEPTPNAASAMYPTEEDKMVASKYFLEAIHEATLTILWMDCRFLASVLAQCEYGVNSKEDNPK